ncbi:MAG: NAD(P)/FAD-dependent oxidoreductase [Chitinispirillaceae bacterium]|nr:NAD(P)/FAD-dependent oxidoreductase [Chitinispirillaceae bacterium]
MEQKFDIAVIGAGPAGSMAAKSAAISGKKVCIFERNSKPGYPVRCGEGIGFKSLSENVDVKERWIKNEIKRSVIVAPDGTKVCINEIDKSVILDREIMDYDLAMDAVKAGAELFVTSPVIEVFRKEKRYICRTPEKEIETKIVIIADGVESRIARYLGWNTTLALDDIECCAFTRVTSPLIENDTCLFFVGSNVAPGGYAWIFPRGKGEANVGLGILGMHSNKGKAVELLKKFIDRELPNGKYTTINCGGVPVVKYTKPLVKEGAMLVGDAARQVNCISGAGIGYALFAGKTAGCIAAKSIDGESVNYKVLKEYEKLWEKKYGKQQRYSFALKEFVTYHTDDIFLNKIAASLTQKKSLKVITIFLSTFSKHPLLMYKAYRMFKG